MARNPEPPNDTKKLFRQCGTCSQTFGHLVDREYGAPAEDYERALSRLAGGIANRGHQCGMLWGAAMAIGAEAGRRFGDPDDAIAVALTTTQQVLASFRNRTGTVDCRDITGRQLDTLRGLAGMMVDTLRKGMNQSTCFELAEAWTPELLEAAEDGLQFPAWHTRTPRSCASQVVFAMGGSTQEAVAVAGFAGGLGLSGNTCGALAAAVWMQGLQWVRTHSGKTPGPWTNTGDKRTLQVFDEKTGGAHRCAEICGRRFDSVDDHSTFVEQGGCSNLIDALASTRTKLP